MREIKFRAWDKTRKVMSEVYLINWFVGKVGIAINGIKRIIPLCDVELMQYTGLKDKNGKQIYEGDIVKHEFGFGNGKGIVYYSPPTFELKEVIGNYVCDEFTWQDWENFEVIGNVHSNPELLEVDRNENN